MATDTKLAYFIPWNEGEPMKELQVADDESLIPELEAAIGVDMLGFSTVAGYGVQFCYDDMGLFNQPGHINPRAMKLWAAAAGRPLADFRQPLVGNYVVLGLDPNTGDTIDLPAAVVEKLTKEWMEQ